MNTRPLLEAVDWEQLERAIFLSPHLDDAALSCAGAIAALRGRISRLTVTIGCGNPLPKSARSRQRKGYASPEGRRAEDVAALAALDCDYVHLGFADCIYRRSPTTGDLIYRASTLRQGRLALEDAAHVEELYLVLRRLCTGMGRVLIFSPMAIGRHVDHVACAQVALRMASPRVQVLFYEDLPYVVNGIRAGSDGPLAALERLGLAPVERLYAEVDVEEKARVVSLYTSQVPLLFAEGELHAALRARAVGDRPAELFWRARWDHGPALGGPA
jgi:LmbE family N-acetylglucosaminyl deacetylase